MITIFLNPSAGIEAIQTAIRNADKAETQGYRVEKGGEHLGVQCWNVFKPSDHRLFPSYIVCAHPDHATCECRQFDRAGYCKHIELTARFEQALESVEYRADEYDILESDRFFMAECQREVLADVEGAWF